MIISVRLTPEDEHKLNWLLNDLNREPKAYSDQTISDVLRMAINNEWAFYNLMHSDENEKELCDNVWLEKYSLNNPLTNSM